MKRYLLKCVDAKMYDQPAKRITLEELQAIVVKDPELRWGHEPRASLPVQNSDGSISQLAPHQGFFVPIAPHETFVVCYEHYEGIAMHCPEDERAASKCFQLAASLDAKIFQI